MDTGPVGRAIGVVTRTGGDKLKVASGEYDKQIDATIIEIIKFCNL